MVTGLFKRQIGYRRHLKQKGFLFCFILSLVGLTSFTMHPYFLSITEIEYKPQEKSIEIACKIFTDDLEAALQKETQVKTEILSASEKQKNEALLNTYFKKHLKISVNGSPVQYELIGFQKQAEAIWTYLEVKNVVACKTVTVFNDLLYDYRQDQINIIHCKINNERKSFRLNYPDKEAQFSF